MSLKRTLTFDELGGAIKQNFYSRARFLIDKEYVKDISLEELAERIYNNFVIEKEAERQANKME